MLTGDDRTVVIHHMEEQPSSPGDSGGGGGRRPVSVLGWIGSAAKGVGSAFFRTLTGPAAGPVLFACICAALAYSTRRRPGKKHRVYSRSVSIAALRGGDTALESILDAQKARLEKEAVGNAAADSMRDILGGDPRDIDYKALHRLAAKLEMNGKEDDAINMLQQALADAKGKNQPHEHELEMVLVEMLIYKGEYDKALKCKCLEDEMISDTRGPLYKAIIYHIKGDGKSAEESYKKFRDIRHRFQPDSFMEGSPLYGVVDDFVKFKEVVDNLKEEIVQAKTEKALIK